MSTGSVDLPAPIGVMLESVLNKINEVVREFEIKCEKKEPECHEANFMFRIESLLRENVWSNLGIQASYEYKVKGSEGFIAKHYGRIDAYYGLMFIEYKIPKPGLASDKVREDALKKIINEYIPGLLKDKRVEELIKSIKTKGFNPLIVGLIFDGRRVIFIEYNVVGGNYRVDPEVGYYELNPDTLRKIIRLVLATYKRKLDAALLASHFGYRSNIAQNFVKIFYEKLVNIEKTGGRPLDLFKEWRKAISIVYPIGEELSEIAKDYGIANKVIDGAKLFFAIQTYYALILKLLGAEVASRFYDKALVSFMDNLKRKTKKCEELFKELEAFELGGPPRWYGIKNLLEGQLFSWYIDVWDDEVCEATKELVEKLGEFDIESLEISLELARDVFKLLYEELVPRKEIRQKLGIYTTPDWLAELILDKLGLTVDNMSKLADERADPLAPLNIRILDPGVGTGTFLVLYIQRVGEYLRRRFKGRIPEEVAKEALRKITRNVVGFDIDALALMTARVNYLIALASTGILPYKGGEDIEIPIYMANSIVPVERLMALKEKANIKVYKIETSSDTFLLPINAVGRLDRLLDLTEKWLEKTSECSVDSLVEELKVSETEACIICEDFYSKLLNLKRSGRDTVWISVIKSYLLPIRLEKSFDYVVGNPPWLSYRFIADPNYQEIIVKPLIKDEYELVTEPQLMTHMEMASLFFVRSIDKFLKNGGKIGFVMPRSIFSADQHDAFRRGRVRNVEFSIDLIIDVNDVEPLFYVPACAVIATKGGRTKYPINAEVLSGKLPENRHKVIALGDALKKLKLEYKQIFLNVIGGRSFLDFQQRLRQLGGKSYYYDKFRNGACIIPRIYWFVDIVDDSQSEVVVVEVAKRAKREESKVRQERGVKPIERIYLYGVLTASELVPFYHLPPNLAILPIKPLGKNYQVLRREVLEKIGHKYMAEWLKEVERLWEEHRGEKAKKTSIYDWLDWQGKLTSHNPTAKYRVVYNASGSHLVASVVKVGPFEVQGVKVHDIIADAKLYVAHVNSEDEAHYLTAILNSNVIDKLIKPMQSKGAFGERDISKKPLEFPIPKFNPDDPIHKRLAELGKICRNKVSQSLNKMLEEDPHYIEALKEHGVLNPRQLGILRRRVREFLTKELDEINGYVEKLLFGSATAGTQGLLKFMNKR